MRWTGLGAMVGWDGALAVVGAGAGVLPMAASKKAR
jgi:hypothetical protein